MNARHETNRRDTAAKGVLSIVMVVAIGWQVVVGYCAESFNQWPFTGYDMYAGSHRIGDATEVLRVRGATVNGQTVEITGEELGISYFGLRFRVEKRLRKLKRQPEELPAYLRRFAEVYNRGVEPEERLIALDILYQGRILMARGLSEPHEKLLYHYEVNEVRE